MRKRTPNAPFSTRFSTFFSTFFLTAATLLGAAFAFAADGEADLLDVRDAQNKPVKLILDTDIGGDIDDAFALALVHTFCDRGKCEFLGVTLTNAEPAAARFVAAFNAKFGRPNVPVGVPEVAGRDTDSYPTKTLAQTLPNGDLEYPVPEGFEPEDSIALLRRLLASAEDGEIVIAQIGFSTNLARLLETPGDEISPLTGRELAAKKVRLVSAMAGSFALTDDVPEFYETHCEWNVICDIASAKKVFGEWPGPIVFSGYEVGDRIRISPTNLRNDYSIGRAKILRDAFWHWTTKNTNEGFDHRRPTWDLTSVLYVLRPETRRGYYTLTEPGKVDVADDGRTTFTTDPTGNRRVFLTDEAARIRAEEAFVNLCSEL